MRADHQVDDPGRQARFLKQFKEKARCKRDPLRRLEDEGISGGNRVGEKPQRDHGRKIEWSDGRGDAERLTNHHFVDACGDVFKVVALHQDGDAAGDLDVLDAALYFGASFSESLSILQRDAVGQIVNALQQQVAKAEEELNSILRGGAGQPGNACAAAAMAREVSASPANSIRAIGSAVAGLTISEGSSVLLRSHVLAM